jgi:ligand-binding sensor domain-containing protein
MINQFNLKSVFILILTLYFKGSYSSQTSTLALKDTFEGNKITAISENDEHIWIGTNNGLVRITKKNGKRRVYHTRNSILPANYITSVCTRNNGHVWIGTLKGIVMNDGYCFFWMNTENTDLPDNTISFLSEDANGILWIGTRTGLVKVCGNKFHQFDIRIKEIKNEKNGLVSFVTSTDQNITPDYFSGKKK